MRKDEYEQYIQRMEDEHRRHLQSMDKALKGAGLELEGEVVRYSSRTTNIAPTWEAKRLAEIRTFEVRARMSDVKTVASDGIQALIEIHKTITDNEPMHPAAENDLREIQEETKRAAKFLIAKTAGYMDNGSRY